MIIKHLGPERSADRRKHHVIYRTTCLVTGKYYIGMHSTDDIADGYMGSGKRLWYSLNKHGREQHRYEVIEHLPSREALRAREAELVTEELISDPMCMNLTLGGGGSWEAYNSNSDLQRRKTIRWNEKRKLIAEVNPEWWRQIAKKAARTRKARGWTPSVETLTACKEASDRGIKAWSGQRHTDEVKAHLSAAHEGRRNSQYGTCWVMTENESKRIPLRDLDEYLANGWVRGRRMKHIAVV